MECFNWKKGGARKPSVKYIEGNHLFFGGGNYKGCFFFFLFFFCTRVFIMQIHTHTHLSLDQGQEWRRSKMQQITTTLPTQKFQTS